MSFAVHLSNPTQVQPSTHQIISWQHVVFFLWLVIGGFISLIKCLYSLTLPFSSIAWLWNVHQQQFERQALWYHFPPPGSGMPCRSNQIFTWHRKQNLLISPTHFSNLPTRNNNSTKKTRNVLASKQTPGRIVQGTWIKGDKYASSWIDFCFRNGNGKWKPCLIRQKFLKNKWLVSEQWI